MSRQFAERMNHVQGSFIREILKVTANPEVISFAGGLPNPRFFPEEEIKEACIKVLDQDGRNALQYSTTEGYLPLRQYIARRYEKKGLKVGADDILITNGSQQGLDLIGKVFLNKGDRVLIESPGYLGAIQAMSVFEPVFESVPMLDDGVDPEQLEQIIDQKDIKLFYAVPNFQNPSGITYSDRTRAAVARILQQGETVFVEDDPYGELRFMGRELSPVNSYLDKMDLLLGSFSKIIAPGLRMGWICTANRAFMEKLVVAKQAADLHTNFFSQQIIYSYLSNHDIDDHIRKIREIYKQQRDMMVGAIEEYFPPEIRYTKPEGGMFLWITLPPGISSLDLFTLAEKEDVAFVPGIPFYADGKGASSLRVNFSNADPERIVEGIKRLAKAIKTLMR